LQSPDSYFAWGSWDDGFPNVGYNRTSKKDRDPEIQRRDLEAFGREKVLEEQISSRGSVARGDASRRWGPGKVRDRRPSCPRSGNHTSEDRPRQEVTRASDKLAGDRFAAARQADTDNRKARKKRARKPTCDRSAALVRPAKATLVRADPTVKGGRGRPPEGASCGRPRER
jgi:hypothetical protein